MKDSDAVALAIPAFFLFMGIEVLVSRFRGQQVFELGDTLANLGCGILQQVSGVFIKSQLYILYYWIQTNLGLLSWDASAIGTWILAIIGVDFLYYWWHRASHRVNFLWAAHIVHHQSENYNLSVALRQSVLTSTTAAFFYLPLAFLGLPISVFGISLAFTTLYQFWIHTKLIGKLGWFELIFNTPSHHRVHHGTNPKYLDRNYGASLIIWDRLFGSFEEEAEEVSYGVVKPFLSSSAIWANLQHWFEIAKKKKEGGWWALVAPPEWNPNPKAPKETIKIRHLSEAIDNRSGLAVLLFIVMLGLSVSFIWVKDLQLGIACVVFPLAIVFLSLSVARLQRLGS